jgi:hypothetical protein
MATAEATKRVTFISKCANQRLTLEPEVAAERDARGRTLAPREPGIAVEFENHEVHIDDPDIIERLREHRLFNTNSHNSFWELGNAPDEPRPLLRDQLEAITRALGAKDADAIQKVVDEELSTHKRSAVLDHAKVALEIMVSDNKDESSAPHSNNSKQTSTKPD